MPSSGLFWHRALQIQLPCYLQYNNSVTFRLSQAVTATEDNALVIAAWTKFIPSSPESLFPVRDSEGLCTICDRFHQQQIHSVRQVDAKTMTGQCLTIFECLVAQL